MNQNIAASASIGKINYKTSIRAGKFQYEIDEPESLGGMDSAPSPFDYLHGALAGCVAVTLKMYIERKGWDLGEITVNVIHRINENDQIVFLKEISTEIEADEAQKKRLINIANKCPVAKLLKEGVEQETVMI